MSDKLTALWAEATSVETTNEKAMTEWAIAIDREWPNVQAELSRMRTALEEIAALHQAPLTDSDQQDMPCTYGFINAVNECAAIAERALTAGSGNE